MLKKFSDLPNDLAKRDVDSLTFADLRYMYGIGESLSTGSGRNKEYSYRNSVKTKVGNIEEQHWCRLMEQLIERSNETWLLDALLQWEKEHNYSKASQAELRKSALISHSYRIFDNPQWVCFIPFNKRYRPEVLKSARIVWILNECCSLPGEATQEQIDGEYEGTVHCPHCGCRSKYTICPVPSEEGYGG